MKKFKVGSYVLATKHIDGRGQWCVGIFVGMFIDMYGKVHERYMVTDNEGNLFRRGGFAKCMIISERIGKLIVDNRQEIEDSGKSVIQWKTHFQNELKKHGLK